MTRATKDRHRWALRLAVAALAVVFVAAHAMMLYSGAALPLAAFASGMVVLAVLWHLGIFAALCAALRRRFF
jgi:hypothetical protein